jgi:copper chaperone CopZ
MACDKDESMDVDVDRIEVNVDENEMDVHDIVQVKGRRRRLTTVASDGGW